MRDSERQQARSSTVVCDFDGTITERDVWDAIVARFDRRDWSAQVRDWAAGTLGSRDFYQQQVREWPATEAEALQFVRAEMRVDPRFAQFAALLQAREIPLYVVSDGFDFYIRAILEREGLQDLPCLANGLRFEKHGTPRLECPYYRADCLRGMANCKCAHLQLWRDRGQRIVYIGDSYSDVCPVRHADLVFAKASLAAYCTEHNIAHVPFASFEQILASPHLAEMLTTDHGQE